MSAATDGIQLNLELYDTDGSTFLIRSNYGSSVSFTYALGPGTFFIKVRLTGGTAGSYTISDTYTPASLPNDQDSNNTSGTAQALALPGSTTGHLGYHSSGLTDSVDWFKISASTGGTLQVQVMTDGIEVNAELYGADGSTFLIRSNYGSSVSFTYALGPGTFFIKLRLTGGLAGSYTLCAAFGGVGCGARTPAAPTTLLATALSASTTSLTWTDNSSNETGFKIERKTGIAGTYTQIGIQGQNLNFFNDSGLTASTQYCYHVRATNAAGDSAYSNESCATTLAAPASPPGSFTLTGNAYCNTTPPAAPAVMLSWTASTGVTSYSVYRNGALYFLGVTQTSFDNNVNVTAGQTYTYFIRATNTAGTRDSNTITVAVPPNVCGTCSLTCAAVVPSTALAGASVAFQATATPTNCTGSSTYDWDFGDGSPHSSQQNPSHPYATAGAFTWHLTAKAGDQACQTLGTINVVTPVGVVLQDIDDLRSPHRLEVGPGDTVNLYYGLRDGSNNPVTASSLLYSLTTSGMSPAPGSLVWSPVGQGIAELTLLADQLGLTAGQTGQISFPTGLGVILIDGLPTPVQSAPGAVSVTRLTTAFTDEWDVYAGGSAGVTGCLGACLKAGSVKASLAAAELSVSGKGGAGLKIKQAADDTLSFERRQEASLGVDLKVPSFEATLGAVSLNATGLDVGVERGVLTAQSFMYRGNKGLNSDEARMMNAACFLESASEMAIVATPFLGRLLKAVVTTATDLSDAPALINAGRIEERFEAIFGGHLTLGIAGVSPSVKLKGGGTVDGFGFSVTGTDIEAAISTTGSTHYKEDSSGSVDTVSRGFQAAFAGSTGPLLMTPFIDCAVIGCGTYAATVSGSVIRDKATSALNGIQFGFETQSGTGIDLDLFRTQDYTGQAVTIDVKDLAITASLVADSLTHLAPIAGNAGTFPIGRQAFSDSLARSFSRAKALATGNTLAYLATVDATSGRVFDLTPSISIEIPHFPIKIDLGFELDYEHRRLVERSRQMAVLASGNWLLAANSSTPSQADGPSLVDVLSTRVFSGIGPLIRSALVNLFGLFSDILPFSPSRAAIASVIDPVTGRSGGSADFGETYGGYRATVATFDPSHPERRSQTIAQGVVFPAAVRWGYTTRRVLPFGAVATREAVLQAEAQGTMVMRLIGNALDVNLKDSNGIELSVFVTPVSLTFPLYSDQITRMGGDPAQVAQTRVFRFEPEARGWSEVPATVAQDQQSVAASATLPGTYAPAQITSFDPNDSDQDGLLDSNEDKNGNGVVDPGETDPSNWDTDGDGVSDGTERALGTDPLDRNSVPNRAPILGYVGNKTIKVGESFSLALKSYDADGNTVTFSAQGLPPGASLDASAGLVTWTPSPAQAGPWHVLFTVQDTPTPGTGPAASDSEIALFTVVGRTTRSVPFR